MSPLDRIRLFVSLARALAADQRCQDCHSDVFYSRRPADARVRTSVMHDVSCPWFRQHVAGRSR